MGPELEKLSRCVMRLLAPFIMTVAILAMLDMQVGRLPPILRLETKLVPAWDVLRIGEPHGHNE